MSIPAIHMLSVAEGSIGQSIHVDQKLSASECSICQYTRIVCVIISQLKSYNRIDEWNASFQVNRDLVSTESKRRHLFVVSLFFICKENKWMHGLLNIYVY